MLQIENLEAFNLNGAIRGMRNPYKNTEKSDSFVCKECYGGLCELSLPGRNCYVEEFKNNFAIGPKDLDLAQRLIKGGQPHDKFMRQIFVSMDINAPLYYWKEMDTYKVATTANSESTMHTITKREFQLTDFSFDESFYNNNDLTVQTGMTLLFQQIFLLNKLRDFYLQEEDVERKKQIWRTIIQMLPSSYMQKRTWSANYATLRNILHQREGHRLSEWKTFIEEIKQLPYANELIFYMGE